MANTLVIGKRYEGKRRDYDDVFHSAEIQKQSDETLIAFPHAKARDMVMSRALKTKRYRNADAARLLRRKFLSMSKIDIERMLVTYLSALSMEKRIAFLQALMRD